MNAKDIAIIGLSVNFHGANNAEEFWNHLENENELFHWYTKEELNEIGIAELVKDLPEYIPVGSIVEGANSFDYSFFGYTKEEANAMDPQIRIMHQQAWLALEDAGYDPLRYRKKIGTFLTGSKNLNWEVNALVSNPGNVNSFTLTHISNKDFMSTLISYSLNLRGPSYAIDTGCSSSLTDIHIACRSLLMRECSMALAGGVRIRSTPFVGYISGRNMTLSRDGHCRSFDEKSTGTVGGEGAALVVLKRLSDAVRDKDNIYAVIRSTACNNDGNRKVGYTAPSVKGQTEVIRMAHKIADIKYDSISYVEAHGSGTRLGDPIEVKALNQAFNNDSEYKCALGTAKTNMGHLNSAAGVVGVIKTCLALKNKKIPASLNFDTPNPRIEFESGPFYINTKTRDWERKNGEPLRAGVSSLGIGGTNVHAILEEYVAPATVKATRPYHLLPFSAKTISATNNYMTALEQYLETHSDLNLADAAYTLQIGRHPFACRNFMVRKQTEKGLPHGIEDVKLKNITKLAKDTPDPVFMFPGEETQYYNMAREIYEGEVFFRTTMDQSFAIFSKITGERIQDVLGYTNDQSISPELINDTRYAQPALFIIEHALASYMMNLGVQPTTMIGHGVGEYVAACLAGVFTVEEGLELVIKRAQLMKQLEGGLVLEVGISAEELENYLNEKIVLAAVNTKNSCVVSGSKIAMNDFVAKLEKNRVRFNYLKTTHDYSLLSNKELFMDFTNALDLVNFKEPKLPFLSSRTGKPIMASDAITSNYWIEQLKATIQFRDGLDMIKKMNEPVLLELGPGISLRLLYNENSDGQDVAAVGLLKEPNEISDAHYYFLYGIGQLWANGVTIDWEKFYEQETRNKISLPGYCFDHHELVLEVSPFEKLHDDQKFTIYPVHQSIYCRKWKKEFLREIETPFIPEGYLIFSDQSEASKIFIQNLRDQQHEVIEVIKGDSFEIVQESVLKIDPKAQEDYEEVFDYLGTYSVAFNSLIFNWPLDEEQENVLEAFYTLLKICKGYGQYLPEIKRKICLLANFGHDIFGVEKSNTLANTVQLINQIFAKEYANVFAMNIDYGTRENLTPEFLSSVQDEIQYNVNASNIAYRNKVRWVDFYDPIDRTLRNVKPLIIAEKTYLVLGGLSEIGSALAYHILENYDATVILTDRHALSNDEIWKDDFKSETLSNATRLILQNLRKLKNSGAKVHYYALDLSNKNVLQQTKRFIERAHGKIQGVIHTEMCELVEECAMIEAIEEKNAVEAFKYNINAIQNIYELFKGEALDFAWFASDLSTVLGSIENGVHATANSYVNAFIETHKTKLKNWVSVGIDKLMHQAPTAAEIIDVFKSTYANKGMNQYLFSSSNINVLARDRFKRKQKANEVRKEDHLSTVNYLAPTTDTETYLCELWESFFGYSNVLGYDKIGVNVSFFDLGGDSLKAMTLIKRINAQYHLELTIQEFFSVPKIEELAKFIDFAVKASQEETKTEKSNSITI